jgi:predicted DNA-binding transcriptional regulator YafY
MNFINWILSWGDDVEVVAPKSIRDIVGNKIKIIFKKYIKE